MHQYPFFSRFNGYHDVDYYNFRLYLVRRYKDGVNKIFTGIILKQHFSLRSKRRKHCQAENLDAHSIPVYQDTPASSAGVPTDVSATHLSLSSPGVSEIRRYLPRRYSCQGFGRCGGIENAPVIRQFPRKLLGPRQTVTRKASTPAGNLQISEGEVNLTIHDSFCRDLTTHLWESQTSRKGRHNFHH